MFNDALPPVTKTHNTIRNRAAAPQVTPGPETRSIPHRFSIRQRLERRQDLEDRKCNLTCAGDTRCLTYKNAPGYGGCCPTKFENGCDIQTTCKHLEDHTRTFSDTYGQLKGGTFFCGVSAPYCQTLIYEHGVSFGYGLTVAHCVSEAAYEDTPNGLASFACTEWTRGSYCIPNPTSTPQLSVPASNTLSYIDPAITHGGAGAYTATSLQIGANATASPSSPSNGNPLSSSANSSRKLTTGSIAGIAVAMFTLGILLTIGGIYFLRRRQIRKMQAAGPHGQPPVEMDARVYPVEMEEQTRSEMESPEPYISYTSKGVSRLDQEPEVEPKRFSDTQAPE